LSERVLLQQFARLPVPGAVKTRLQPQLSAEEACVVHGELMLLTATSLMGSELGKGELWLDRPGTHPVVSHCLALGLAGPLLQRGEDLGERMARALCDGLARAERVLLVGSDCPALDPSYLAAAVAALDDSELVFGPAEDGGFVLVGARRVPPGLFSGIDWGRDDVLAQCLRQLQELGEGAAQLEPRWDVDRPEDLRRWRGDPGLRRVPD
jgi:rSAM/selenodomain-associated transferase 1